MNDLWHVVLPEQSAEEYSGGPGLAVFLQEDVQHGSMVIDRPPQPMFDAAHVHAHLVEMPGGEGPGRPWAK